LAIASRDPRLCAGAVEEDERATCIAITGHEPAACAKLARAPDRLHCERGAARWRTVVAAAPARTALGVVGELHLESSAGGPPTDVDFGSELRQGLVLQEQLGGSRLAIGAPPGEGPDRFASPTDRHDDVSVELVVAPAAPSRKPSGDDLRPVRIERIDVTVRGVFHSLVASARTASAGDSALSAKVVSFERVRGGRVDISIEGTFGDGARAPKGRLRIATFVRDVVGPADVYSPRSPFAADRTDEGRAVALDAGKREP
jgi:hypothetical protein